jgi:biopolymer transport protein ExbB
MHRALCKQILTAAFVAPLASQAASAQEIDILEQISHGGVAIVAILALSVLGLAVTIERFVHLRKKSIAPDGLIEKVVPLWHAGEFEKITRLLEDEDSTLARVINYAVAHRHCHETRIANGCGDISSLELRRHQQKAYPLAIVATVAPIIGLLGTVIGMIEAFQAIAFSGAMGDPALLAGGISKALVNTASGLSVALPALAFHHFFKNRMVFLSLSLEEKINQLLNECVIPASQSHPLQIMTHAH